jgi:hypothetical protein
MVTTAVDKPDPSMVLMAAISGTAAKTNFKIALERDPSKYLVEFYHEIERHMR